jgi:hypothetical protein
MYHVQLSIARSANFLRNDMAVMQFHRPQEALLNVTESLD